VRPAERWIFAPKMSKPCSIRPAVWFAHAWNATSKGRRVAVNGSGSGKDLQCIEFVSLVTAYLDGEVNEQQRRGIDQHLKGCRGCRAALNQFQTVIRLAGRLTATDVADVDPLIRDRLTATLQIPRRR
jgi:hypothetical protein